MSVGYKFGSWTILGDENQTIAASAAYEAGNINNEGKVATELSVVGTYGADDVGANIVIRRLLNTGAYETAASATWVVPIPALASATRERVVTIPGDVSGCRIQIDNNGANSMTNVTVRYRQATLGE